MKPIQSMTLGEAEAYRQGYKDGATMAIKKVAARITPDVGGRTELNRGLPQCYTEDPYNMCGTCNCWKMFREYCS